MKLLKYNGRTRFILPLLVLSSAALLTACDEANIAIDHILGTKTPVLSAASPTTSQTVIEAKKSMPGEKAPAAVSPAPPTPAPQTPAPSPTQPQQALPQPVKPQTPQVAQQPEQGKRRLPGQMAPGELPKAQVVEDQRQKEPFVTIRDPFRQPTEILPSECPPSMPLCRFDRSQLKLVGVIQVSEGFFKGMVEDPDGRGYFIGPGMQIGGATVTQVSNKGITLHIHKTRQDVLMPLFREVREAAEF